MKTAKKSFVRFSFHKEKVSGDKKDCIKSPDRQGAHSQDREQLWLAAVKKGTSPYMYHRPEGWQFPGSHHDRSVFIQKLE